VWTLTLPDTPEMRDRLANGQLDDLMIMLTYEGSTPAWPA
jgi:spore germination protein YaaH